MDEGDIKSGKFFLEIAWNDFQYSRALIELSDSAACEKDWAKMAEYLQLAEQIAVPYTEEAWVSSLSYLFEPLDLIEIDSIDGQEFFMHSADERRLITQAYKRFLGLSISEREEIQDTYLERYNKYSLSLVLSEKRENMTDVDILFHLRFLILET